MIIAIVVNMCLSFNIAGLKAEGLITAVPGALAIDDHAEVLASDTRTSLCLMLKEVRM